MDFAPAGDDLGVKVLGTPLNGGIDGEERLLGIEDLFDAGAEFRPCLPGEIEIRTQIEQGGLADLSADSFGLDKAVGEVGTAGAA